MQTEYFFLILYLIAAALNLIASLKKNKILFGVTKPALLLLLCLYVFFRTSPTPDWLMIAAFAACWLGDVLLMINGEVWFTAGGVSFFAGHVMLIVIFARLVDLGHLPFAVLIPAAVVYAAAAGYVMYRAKKNAPKIMQIPMFLYLLCNAVTNLFALARLIGDPGVWSAVSYVGAILFFLSDCALFLLRYDKGKKSFFKSDFFVMLTYISGVLLIALGLAPPVN